MLKSSAIASDLVFVWVVAADIDRLAQGIRASLSTYSSCLDELCNKRSDFRLCLGIPLCMCCSLSVVVSEIYIIISTTAPLILIYRYWYRYEGMLLRRVLFMSVRHTPRFSCIFQRHDNVVNFSFAHTCPAVQYMRLCLPSYTVIYL